MDTLTLCDLHGFGRDELISHIVKEYAAKREDVERFDFLVAYESVKDWGCGSSSWFLLRDKGTGELYEVSGSHCSCYGFEGQWEPSQRWDIYSPNISIFILTSMMTMRKNTPQP